MTTSFMHVHLVALRYFAATVRIGSMRKAAETLHVTPSAINRQILKLEDQLRCKLFERRSKGVHLTAAGEVLHYYVLSLERSLERTIAQLDDLRGLRSGHVMMVTEDGVGRDFLSHALAPFHDEYPRVTFTVEVMAALEILGRIAAGTTDIGVAMSPPTRSDVAVTGREEIPLGIITRPDHRLAGKRSVNLEDIAGEPVIHVKEDMGASDVLYSHIGSGMLRGGFVETNASDFVTALVKSGVGIGVRTPIGIMDEIAHKHIVFMPLRDPKVSWPDLVLYAKPERNLPTAGAVLLERLRDALPSFRARVNALIGYDPDKEGGPPRAGHRS